MANTRKSLLFSALSLLLCCALLVGTTFAWFTDSVTNTGNKIQAGDLKISAVMYDLQKTAFGDTEDDLIPEWSSWDCGFLLLGADTLDLGKGDYFALGFAKEGTDFEGSNAFISDTLFEPGKTYVRQLRIKNDGSLAAKVKLQFDITDNSLSDALWFAVLDIKEANGRQRVSTINETLDSIELSLTPNNFEDLVFVFGMDEEAGNEYMNKSFAASLSIYATQYTYEEDGFGSDQYDKDAVYMQKNVSYDETKTPEQNGAALQAAILSAKDGETIYVEKGEYDMPRGDTVLEGQSGWYFPITADNVSIIGEEGAVITGSDVSANGAWSSQNTVTIFGDNVTLEGFTIKCKMDCNKAIEVIGKNSTIRNVKVLCNDLITHEEYLEKKGIEAGSETDYWEFYRNEFAGSVYYSGDVGNAVLDNFYIEKAWVSTTAVTAGTVSLNNVTIDYAGCGYADTSLPISANAAEVFVNGAELTVRVDNEMSASLGSLAARVPAGATILLAADEYSIPALDIGSGSFVLESEEGATFNRIDEGFITIRGAENASMTVRGIDFAGQTANDTSGTRGICFSGQANSNVTLTVEDCRFSNLTTGIFLGGVANATITGCSFTDCFAGIGGSEDITGTLAVDDCSFSGNTENIGWAGAGEIVITNSPSCESYMDYTKTPAEEVNLRAEVTASDDPAANSAALSDAVESVGDGGTVFVSGNYELASGISVNKDVSFIGTDGAVISGAPITASANVTFKNIALEKPTNSNKNASLIYGYAGCETIVLENCVFNDPQWEVIQITSKDLKSLVITGCTFTAADVDGAESSYGNSANQAIRYIHIQPGASDNVVADITITNNTFMDCENVVDSVVGIFYIAEGSTLTVGGNTFEGLEPEADGSTGKLCFGWPCMDGIDNIDAWTGAEQTFTYPG